MARNRQRKSFLRPGATLTSVRGGKMFLIGDIIALVGQMTSRRVPLWNVRPRETKKGIFEKVGMSRNESSPLHQRVEYQEGKSALTIFPKVSRLYSNSRKCLGVFTQIINMDFLKTFPVYLKDRKMN